MAALHIVIICHTGMLTNERVRRCDSDCSQLKIFSNEVKIINQFETRQVVNAVLRIVPDQNADLDRFQVRIIYL